MPVRNGETVPARPPQSEVDRRVIGAVGQLLVAGIWLERQLKSAPLFRTGFAETFGRLGPAMRTLPTGATDVSQRPGDQS
jgi:hypothetical protein